MSRSRKPVSETVEDELEAQFDDDLDDDGSLEPKVIIPGTIQFKKSVAATFFANKEMHCGGEIPEYLLFSDRYISDAMAIMIGDAVNLIYRAMGTAVEIINEDEWGEKQIVLNQYGQPIEELDEPAELQKDIKSVLNVLQICSSQGVPKDLAGGILLMYMELCEGLRIKI